MDDTQNTILLHNQPISNDFLGQVTPLLESYCRANAIDIRLLSLKDIEDMNRALIIDNVVREGSTHQSPFFIGTAGEDIMADMLGQTKPSKTPNDPVIAHHDCKKADKNGDGIISWTEAVECEEKSGGYMQGYATD